MVFSLTKRGSNPIGDQTTGEMINSGLEASAYSIHFARALSPATAVLQDRL